MSEKAGPAPFQNFDDKRHYVQQMMMGIPTKKQLHTPARPQRPKAK
jgi:hypothetical protein